jgi:hypothetical protein
MVVAYKRFCAEPRAAMGIQSPVQDLSQHGMVLGMIMPNFPCSEVLRVNDRLLSVDGQQIADISDMQRVVFAHDPGDEVAVSLQRDGATLHLKVKLGRYLDLKDNKGNPQQLLPEMLERAWEFRASTYPEPKQPPIESGLSSADWRRDFQLEREDGGDPTEDPRLAWDQARFKDMEPGEAAMVAAGEARGAMQPMRLSAQQANGLGPNFRVLPGNGQILIPDPRQDVLRNQARRDELIRVLRQRIEQNREDMKNLPENQRIQRMQENQLLQLQIDRLEQRPRPLKP